VSDVARRRIAALLLIAGIAVAVLAAADVGPFEDPVPEEERVADAVERFFGAAAAGDAKTFCDMLTTDARKTLQVNTAQRLATDDPPSCEELVTLLEPLFEGSTIDVQLVSISGTKARVESRYKLESGPAQPRTVLLSFEDEAWRISDPG
jgi:hypothetical protein